MQLAWLCSAPKRSEKDDNPKPRINSLKEGSTAGNLPDALPFLVMCFDLIGRCKSAGMGRVPVGWTDVDSFCNRSGYDLTGWESEQLIKMSADFCYMLHKAGDLQCPPPYRESVDEDDTDTIQEIHKNVDRKLDQLFGK